jgi:division protein CdvB (Snf7/Vps24/ESCRT-III family)
MFRYISSIIVITISQLDMNSRWVKSESIVGNNYTSDDGNNNNSDQTIFLPRPGGPLKPRLDAVKKKIQVQVDRLDELHSINRLKHTDTFRRLTTSINENDTQHSTLLSSELTRIRQVSRVLLLSHVALDKLIAELSSASDFQDIVIVLSPAMAIVKNLRSSITPSVPEMEEELGVISELLSGILVDAGQVGGYTINFEVANEEAVTFIEDVSRLVEQKMNVEFPQVPELPVICLKLGQTGFSTLDK